MWKTRKMNNIDINYDRKIVNKNETKLTARPRSPRRWCLAIRVPSCRRSCRSSCCRKSRTTPSWTAARTRPARPASRTGECSWRWCSWGKLFPSFLVLIKIKMSQFRKNVLIVRHMFCHWRQNKNKRFCVFVSEFATQLNEGTQHINCERQFFIDWLNAASFVFDSNPIKCSMSNGEREIVGIPADDVPVCLKAITSQRAEHKSILLIHKFENIIDFSLPKKSFL